VILIICGAFAVRGSRRRGVQIPICQAPPPKRETRPDKSQQDLARHGLAICQLPLPLKTPVDIMAITTVTAHYKCCPTILALHHKWMEIEVIKSKKSNTVTVEYTKAKRHTYLHETNPEPTKQPTGQPATTSTGITIQDVHLLSQSHISCQGPLLLANCLHPYIEISKYEF